MISREAKRFHSCSRAVLLSSLKSSRTDIPVRNMRDTYQSPSLLLVNGLLVEYSPRLPLVCHVYGDTFPFSNGALTVNARCMILFTPFYSHPSVFLSFIFLPLLRKIINYTFRVNIHQQFQVFTSIGSSETRSSVNSSPCEKINRP